MRQKPQLASSFGNKASRALAATSPCSAPPLHDTHLVLVHDPSALVGKDKTAGGRAWDEGGSSSSGGASLLDKEGIVSVLRRFRHPVVLIVSDVTGKDDMKFAVDSLVPPHLRNRCLLDTVTGLCGISHLLIACSVNMESIFCNPITSRNVQKVLTKIAGTLHVRTS